tara:strand:+ start:693 stop:1964 length:1272 start_codon:yes stop_codon:yes gene_type:complete
MNLHSAIKESRKIVNSSLYDFSQLEDIFLKANSQGNFQVEDVGLSNLKDWNFDNVGNFSHKSERFFKIVNVSNNIIDTGILLQNEIGTLGLISCIYEENFYVLVQLKKEPGNKLSAQLSPTLQATLSNQNKIHGGSAPKYLEIFENIEEKETIFQKNLPEQGNRYWRKFNKNIVVLKDYFKEEENFLWMTLGQIYEFTKYDNSINSCLRSVLSLVVDERIERKNIEFSFDNLNEKNKSKVKDSIVNFYDKSKDELCFETLNDKFHIKGIKISIEDREVKSWDQPIIYDPYLEEYIILSVLINGERKYILRKYYEPGYEKGFVFGPTITNRSDQLNSSLEDLKLFSEEDINFKLIKTIEMSEEGGRFLQTTVKHSFYELTVNSELNVDKNYEVLSMNEINNINNIQLLSMEARSLIFFANHIYN